MIKDCDNEKFGFLYEILESKKMSYGTHFDLVRIYIDTLSKKFIDVVIDNHHMIMYFIDKSDIEEIKSINLCDPNSIKLIEKLLSKWLLT